MFSSAAFITQIETLGYAVRVIARWFLKCGDPPDERKVEGGSGEHRHVEYLVRMDYARDDHRPSEKLHQSPNGIRNPAEQQQADEPETIPSPQHDPCRSREPAHRKVERQTYPLRDSFDKRGLKQNPA